MSMNSLSQILREAADDIDREQGIGSDAVEVCRLIVANHIADPDSPPEPSILKQIHDLAASVNKRCAGDFDGDE